MERELLPRTKVVIAASAALLLIGGTAVYGAAAPQPVACTLDANTLTCPLPTPPTVTVTTTVTAAPSTVTVTSPPTTTPPVSTTPTTTTATTTTTTTPPATQTLGVGGVATPPGATKTTTDSSSALTITTGGTQTNPKVYDGQAHTVGTLTVRGNWITVQNFNVRATGQYGIYSEGTGITIQNNDIKGLHPTGDGDLNAFTFFGNNTTIAYNTAIDFVTGNPGGSHTDAIQTWVSSSHPTPSSNVLIKGNKFTGPANPSRSDSIASIHQCVMAEDAGRGGNTGGTSGMTKWLIDGNTFGDSWNQCIKLDGIDNADITRNSFIGSSDRAVEFTSGTGQRFWSDNTVGSGYGSVGAAITPGTGPTTY
jgi:hypothetical protein